MYNFFDNFFGDSFINDLNLISQILSNSTVKPCDQCGCTYEEFRKTGLLGCGNCYNAFYSEIEPMLKEIQFNTRHKGKIPMRSGVGLRKEQKLAKLKEQLNEAVRKENYEEAAKIHKSIRQLEDEK